MRLRIDTLFGVYIAETGDQVEIVGDSYLGPLLLPDELWIEGEMFPTDLGPIRLATVKSVELASC